MPRTKIANEVKERIATRLAILSGNTTNAGLQKVETIYWTLAASGFSEDVIEEITAHAEKLMEDFDLPREME